MKGYFPGRWSWLFTALCIVTFEICAWGVRNEMRSEGDGAEYCFMLHNFCSHFSICGTEGQIREFGDVLRQSGYFPWFKVESIPEWPHSKGFTRKEGTYFSNHTGAYVICASPIAMVHKWLTGDEFKGLMWFNIILMIGVVWGSWLFFPGSRLAKLALVFAHLFSPVNLYLAWPHAEVFLYAMICFSLLAFVNRRIKLAAFFGALVASQNQSAVFLPIAIGIWFLILEGRKIISGQKPLVQEWGLMFLAVSPILGHPIFYLCRLGCPSIMAKIQCAPGITAVSPSYFSLDRVWSMFFDLDQGLIMACAPAVIVFFVFPFVDVARQKFRMLWLPTVTIAIVLSTCVIINWNSGCIGISRYAAWISALVLMYAVCRFDAIGKCWIRRLLLGLLLSCAILQGVFFYCADQVSILFIHHNAIAKFALDYFPGLYNPNIEVFITRERGFEFSEALAAKDECGYPVFDSVCHYGVRSSKLLLCRSKMLQALNDYQMAPKQKGWVSSLVDAAKRNPQDHYLLTLPNDSFLPADSFFPSASFMDFDFKRTSIPIAIRKGFYSKEDWGMWSSGDVAFGFRLPRTAAQTCCFGMTLISATGPKSADVYCNGKFVAHWDVITAKATEYEFRIPNTAEGAPVFLVIKQSGLRAPCDCGPGNQDKRLLGLGFVSMRLIPDVQRL